MFSNSSSLITTTAKNMLFKFVLLAAAVLGVEVNAQIGIVRPFATGFSNGYAEVAKPFGQLAQPFMAPSSEFMAAQRFPYIPQMMTYPSKIVPRPQGAVYEGLDAANAGVPELSYIQNVRPSVGRPQVQFIQIPSQFLKPVRPFPVPVEETVEIHRPSSLLIKPETEIPKPDVNLPLDEGFAGPSAQIENKE